MTSSLLVLLPPSETKRDGGNTALRGRLTGCADGVGTAEPDAAGLRWPALEPVREAVAADLERLARDPEATAAALRLGTKIVEQETARNRVVRTSPRVPAALRYTGVLYDALDAASLDAVAWGWLREHVAVHSALYGLVGADEAIAAYRCSAGSRLGGASLRARWSAPIRAALEAHEGTVLDLRSSSYATLGPAPATSISVDIVSHDGAGGVRALNHFNKHAKGEFVRALATNDAGRTISGNADAGEIAAVAREIGFNAVALERNRLRLIVRDPVRT